MKPVLISSLNRKRRQAMALILVIITVALLSMLIVAIFSITRTEYKSTQSYVAAKVAKQIGDSAVAIVEAQIQNGQNTSSSASRTTHATQPGMVRVYNSNGSFNAAYKLYSSAIMKVTGDESSLYGDTHIPPSTWHTQPARYVDLNDPVIRPALSTTATTAANSYAVYFPVIDPRAAWNYGAGGQSAGDDGSTQTTQVEGFSYVKKTPSVGSGGNQDYSTKVVLPTEASAPEKLRLPMPVEWLYVLQDGTVGALDTSNKFIGTSGTTEPSATNPIVGRVAFWTDDESCKININTAAEPTYMSTPYYYHQRDAKWAHFPAVTGEYQRYPGHPATVALSAVLAPNFLLDPLLPQADNLSDYMDIVNLKEQIYQFAPKIAGGGSEGGTRPFVRDDLSGQNGEREASNMIDLTNSVKERLYASVDEMLFKDLIYTTTTGREAATLTLPNSSNFFDHDKLEHSRFFLTAHSRSPEFSIHGLPRICMWPVSDETLKQTQWRTSFDNAIALCATIKKNATSSDTTTRSYFFRRAHALRSTPDAKNSNADVDINRNIQLLDFLAQEMSSLNYPATSYSSGGGRSTFKDKYGSDNVNQMAVQFFDYIRSTNLYDGILARKNDAWSMNGKSGADLYNYRDQHESQSYTFTSPRIAEPPSTINNSGAEQGIDNRRTSQEGILPGHGQVSPAIWNKGGRSYKGFGRMFTISEIGFQFICTGDGAQDGGSLQTFAVGRPPVAQPKGLGGSTAIRYDVNPDNAHPPASAAYPGMNVPQGQAVWWSNFPPLGNTDLDIANAISVYGCEARANSTKHPSRHPGFDPANWNMTLPQNVWLEPNQKRVQVMLMLETFCPSVGWTGIYPEYTIVLDGRAIAKMQLNGQPLFNTSGDVAIKSNGNIYRADDTHSTGGHAPPSAIAGGRRTRNISNGNGIVLMPADPNYDNNNTSGHQALQNFDFISDFVTVDRTAPMQITFPSEEIKIQIFDTHDYLNAKPVQILHVNFGQAPSTYVPVPDLAQSRPYTQTTDSYGRIVYTRSLQGPHYWCANYNGCLGLMQGRFNPQYGSAGQPPWSSPPALRDLAVTGDSLGSRQSQGIRGRLDNASGLAEDTRKDVRANGVSIIAGVDPATNKEYDVIRTLVPAIGDYRTLAAMYDVPASWWKPHPLWSAGLQDLRQAHSFTGQSATSEPGAKIAIQVNSAIDATSSYDSNYRTNLQLIGGARFDINAKGDSFKTLHPRNADLPPDGDYASAANAFGDFDAGVGSCHEGPYINKPDEGNFFAANENRGGSTKYWRSSYFFESWQNADDWRSGIYMTPNRLISSPVMFGSLPTGVWGNASGLPSATDSTSFGGLSYAPWQTLLFRPHTHITSQQPNSNTSHPGLQDPADHYLLDLFFMPVVEPYAISEPLSVAGRINMNYQIMPFTHIRRATAMHAVMKGEYITAIPNNQITAAKEYYPGMATWSERFWNDAQDKRYWHRPIDARATLRQFDLKFSHQSGGSENYQGLFRSASQICQMHLIPKIMSNGSGTSDPSNVRNASSQSTINQVMDTFWSENRPTADNVRERPYSNLYARLTTRSNTFRVHVRAQVLKKARSTAANTFDPDKDAVNGEYRGSYLIERFIDPNDPTITIPDYGASSSPLGQEPLDTFYRFRVLETKRFNP